MAISSNIVKVLCLVVILSSARSSLAAEYTVGDQIGWRPQFDYYSWVHSKPIKLGDTLVFNYDVSKGYSVAEVTQFKFIACNATDAKYFDNSGQSRITLTTAGQHYFLSAGHCQDQMVFSVLV